MSKSDFLTLELDVLDWDHGQLNVTGRKVFGHPRLSPELLVQLRGSEADLKEYGTILFDALLPDGDPMRISYRKALDDARRSGKSIRFKLTLSLSAAEQLHQLRWESLYDRVEKAALARNPETAFSRYAPIGRDDAVPTLERLPRLLVAVATPTDCEQHKMAPIDRETMGRRLELALRPLDGQMAWEIMTAPVTPSRLQARLAAGDFQALHLVAHGYVDSKRQTGVLVLEQPSGQCDFEVAPVWWTGSVRV